MAEGVFDSILLQAIRKGIGGEKTIESGEWFRKKAREISYKKGKKIIGPSKLLSDPSRASNSLIPGNMYFYEYDPKGKKKLPYYDRYPLIFLVDYAKSGFYGINLHYLPLNYRAMLMNNLFSVLNNNFFSDNTKLNLNYDILKGAGKLKYFKPCFKHYLYSHVRVNPVFIHSIEWQIAIFLPLQRFIKASKEKVYSDSKRIIDG